MRQGRLLYISILAYLAGGGAAAWGILTERVAAAPGALGLLLVGALGLEVRRQLPGA